MGVELKETKYTEIFKLKEMLENANIPFVFNVEIFETDDKFKFERYHLEYPCTYHGGKRTCSVVEGTGTYGGYQNLLEIMGLLTDEESAHDSVSGWLTADDVFERIKNHHERSR